MQQLETEHESQDETERATAAPSQAAPSQAASSQAARPKSTQESANALAVGLAVGAARFVTLLALSIWLGGILFLGAVAAPAAFKINRALGPQLVGAMLLRFNPITVVCGVLMLLGWFFEGRPESAQSSAKRGRLSRRLWKVQGACSGAMLALTLFLSLVMMPRIVQLQPAVVPAVASSTSRTLTPVAPAKAEFDRLHSRYTQLTLLCWWLGIGTLGCLSWRSARRDAA